MGTPGDFGATLAFLGKSGIGVVSGDLGSQVAFAQGANGIDSICLSPIRDRHFGVTG